MHDTFFAIALSSIFVIPTSAVTIHYISLVKCYRVVTHSHLNMNNEIITRYVVEQKHSLFRDRITWWKIESSGDEYSDGSVYDKLEDANQYIKSRLFDSKESIKISNVICENSPDRDVKFEV